MGIKDDYYYCENIIKKNSNTFYKAFSLLKKQKADAIYAIYAFCRLSDDSIDKYNSFEKLSKIKMNLDNFNNNKIPDEPLWRALKDVFNKFDMNIKPFYEMIEGQELDSNFRNIKTQNELLDYSYYVASTVGLMILPIIATKNHEKLIKSSISLGKAMQITNILRDIGEDLENNRIYIPKEILDKFNYSYKNLEDKIINDEFINLWEYEAGIAQNHYDIFYKEVNLFDKDAILAVYASAKLYNEILNSIRKNNYNCFTKKNYVHYKNKLKIINQIKQKIKLMEV